MRLHTFAAKFRPMNSESLAFGLPTRGAEAEDFVVLGSYKFFIMPPGATPHDFEKVWAVDLKTFEWHPLARRQEENFDHLGG